VIISTFVITANDIQKIKELEQAFHLWLLRINYLKQPSHYPSITFAQQRQPSTREIEKMHQNKARVIIGLPNEVSTQLKAIANQYNA
ncbi:LLM class flavin-dependent oxidoreductase, partial [Staphylococcus epidermidis]